MRGRAVFLCSLLAIPCAYASVSLEPTRFTYGPGNASAKVHLDAFIDLLCPDSKMAFGALKELVKRYRADELWLTFILFPLPYHQHSYAVAEATYVITKTLGAESFSLWIEKIYANQHLYSNMQTKDMSAVQVINELKSLVISTFLKFPAAQWDQEMTGYGGTAADNTARVAWKYASSKGTYGTPQYHLNGKAISINGTWTVKDWCSLIDAYLKHSIPSSNIARPTQSVIVGHDTTINCRPQKHACTYLNSKSMCCNPGEQCSTQHGCLHAV